MQIKDYIEHTLLKPTALASDMEQLAQEAVEYGMFGVCIPPYWVKKIKRDLKNTPVSVVSVIGFPLGYQMSQAKVAEALQAVHDGADELDVVMNLSAFKANPKGWVKPEFARLAKELHEASCLLKVILETAYLTDEEIVLACQICMDAGVDFVKTSTGFAPQGATVEHIQLMRQTVGNALGVKASGGVRNYEQAIAMIEAGADRIGTSAGVAICKEG